MQGFKVLALALVISFSLDAKKSPNFVLVYMDDLGWAETSVEMIKGRADTRSDPQSTGAGDRDRSDAGKFGLRIPGAHARRPRNYACTRLHPRWHWHALLRRDDVVHPELPTHRDAR